ncbi:putative dienelactone hydrolase family protein [Lyophyllum shimeji]|uniref:Dienelactone hydrolase family protein n=1 Tax=Lyophyllum shimeji TaxID=47721 RepID=A0A9P3PKB7_LYOSH|nr:putative dienelactone hydrolase family protein [Lyophyllum shimeji]
MTSSSPVLAGAPGDCCFRGVKHAGTARGKATEIAGIRTYISEPPAGPAGGPNKIILFCADVYGPFFLNNQLIQDYFAEHGFLVLGIDYFFGDAIYLHLEKEGFDRNAWIQNARQKAIPAFPGWLHKVRETYGADAKYYAVGYCFGAPFALELATTDNVAASAFAHPAFLNEDHFTKLTKPLLLSCAEIDHTFPLESRRRAEDLLVSIKAKYYIQVFSGVSHGFAVRGDPEVENERWAKEECARSIIAWFTRFSTGTGRSKVEAGRRSLL